MTIVSRRALVARLANSGGRPTVSPTEGDFLLLLMTSRITSSLLFPLPVTWPSLDSVLLPLVRPFSMPSLDPTLDRADRARFHNCISTTWQHNGVCEWCKPLFSCSRLVLLSGGEFISHGFDVLISDGGGGLGIVNQHSHPFHTVKHAKLSSRWGEHVEKLWRSCKYKYGGEGK